MIAVIDGHGCGWVFVLYLLHSVPRQSVTALHLSTLVTVQASYASLDIPEITSKVSVLVVWYCCVTYPGVLPFLFCTLPERRKWLVLVKLGNLFLNCATVKQCSRWVNLMALFKPNFYVGCQTGYLAHKSNSLVRITEDVIIVSQILPEVITIPPNCWVL